MNPDAVLKSENEDAVSAVLENEKAQASSCATGKCPFSSPKFMFFSLPFFAVLAIVQWTASIECQMGVLSKTAVALLAGMIGLAVQKVLAKR